MAKTLALKGQRFGRLLVLERHGLDAKNAVTWNCQCDCGKDVIAIGWVLNSGKLKSCGCLQREATKKACTTHGLSHTSEYRVYRGMLNRCYNKSDTNYHKYGAKGVTVCDRWNPKAGGSFENFIEDMGFRPSPYHQLDKEAINLGNNVYCPEYCRWVPAKTNQRNRKNIMKVMYQGKEICVVDLARQLGINNATLQNRIKRGWPEHRWSQPV